MGAFFVAARAAPDRIPKRYVFSGAEPVSEPPPHPAVSKPAVRRNDPVPPDNSTVHAIHLTQTYSYDANGNNTSGDGRTIAYTAFDKPKSIDKGNHATTFAYRPDRSRIRRVDTVTEGTGASRTMSSTTTLYLGGVEKITRPSGHTRIKRHIGGIVIETIGSGDGGCGRSDATAVQYVLRDHLGSLDVLTDTDGDIDLDMRFDLWGLHQNAATGQALSAAARESFDHCATTRGFTGHEMLDEVGIIHLNWRIHDPLLARFLQGRPLRAVPGRPAEPQPLRLRTEQPARVRGSELSPHLHAERHDIRRTAGVHVRGNNCSQNLPCRGQIDHTPKSRPYSTNGGLPRPSPGLSIQS